jgi:putative membrane protein
LIGVTAIYIVTQTQFDYLSRFMFFVHRGQHLVLHHVAAFLMALAAPWSVLAAGTPRWVREKIVLPAVRSKVLRGTYALLQNAVVAPVLFVGLIYFWLVPAIHFDAMLSFRLYEVMNWSMLIDGLLFWWLILSPSADGHGRQRLRVGVRILLVLVIMPPQIILGAYITFSRSILFDVYEVCGRAWPIEPLTDQQLGGLLTWIPPAMMSGIATLVLLGRLVRLDSTFASDPASQRV